MHAAKCLENEKRRKALALEHGKLKEAFAALQKEAEATKTELATAAVKIESLEAHNKKTDERLTAVLMLSRENQAFHFRHTMETFSKKRQRVINDEAYASKKRRAIDDEAFKRRRSIDDVE